MKVNYLNSNAQNRNVKNVKSEKVEDFKTVNEQELREASGCSRWVNVDIKMSYYQHLLLKANISFGEKKQRNNHLTFTKPTY